jgi:hypothetical protein
MGRSMSFERCSHCETPNTETERAPKRPPRRASALAAAFESSRRRINEVAKRGRVCAVRRWKNRVSPPFLRPSSTWRTGPWQVNVNSAWKPSITDLCSPTHVPMGRRPGPSEDEVAKHGLAGIMQRFPDGQAIGLVCITTSSPLGMGGRPRFTHRSSTWGGPIFRSRIGSQGTTAMVEMGSCACHDVRDTDNH